VSVEHWETYYRGGGLVTCPTGPEGNYSLEIRDAWVEFYASLADCARVLDVGTGNGAVALIARDTLVAAGRTSEVHGSDLALIDPPRQVRGGAGMFDGITFHAGVATEHLPFEAESIDAVSGQFALEYTEVEASLREIARVLRPGGRARFSIHHADSVVVGNARQGLAQTQLVLEDTRVFRKLRSFLAAEREAERDPRSRTRAGEAWNELGRAGTQLQQALAAAPGARTLLVTIDAVQKLLSIRRRMSPAQLEREVDKVEREVRSSARRLKDLLESARDEAGVRAIATAGRAAGLVAAEPRPQFQAGDTLVGWLLDFSKPVT
jgi:ubiquinone/menaquinone biosynthesis C-methylase UbiE